MHLSSVVILYGGFLGRFLFVLFFCYTEATIRRKSAASRNKVHFGYDKIVENVNMFHQNIKMYFFFSAKINIRNIVVDETGRNVWRWRMFQGNALQVSLNVTYELNELRMILLMLSAPSFSRKVRWSPSTTWIQTSPLHT